MRDRQSCVDCEKLSPETETNYTLISSQFGWRLTRWRGERGEFHVEWRCPDCWREHKRAKQAAEESGGTHTRPSNMPPPGAGTSTRPPLQTRPLPSFPSRAPPPVQIGPLPPIPRPPPRPTPPRGSTPPPPMTSPRKPTTR